MKTYFPNSNDGKTKYTLINLLLYTADKATLPVSLARTQHNINYDAEIL
jgi:hypothetical protein